MGNSDSQITVSNSTATPVYFKLDTDKAYIQKLTTEVNAAVGAKGVEVSGGVSVAIEYDWSKVLPGFECIPGMDKYERSLSAVNSSFQGYYVTFFCPLRPDKFYGPVYFTGAQNITFTHTNNEMVVRKVFSNMSFRVSDSHSLQGQQYYNQMVCHICKKQKCKELTDGGRACTGAV